MHFQHDEFRVRWQTPVRRDLNAYTEAVFFFSRLQLTRLFVPTSTPHWETRPRLVPLRGPLPSWKQETARATSS